MTVQEWLDPLGDTPRGRLLPLDVSTGYWIAGFIDGEGCFVIAANQTRHRRINYPCSFVIKLRADDRDVLELLAAHLGFGTVRDVGGGDGKNRHPQVAYMVTTKRDCVRLTEILDVFPLRSKKARDYAIWRDAAVYWANSCRPVDWAPMVHWYDELRGVRAYATARQAEASRLKDAHHG